MLCITLIGVVSLNCYSKNEVETLSPELRELLQQEMLEIQKGMQNIIPALASGNYKEVTTVANKINKSFILKQKITKQQKHELKDKLPNAFILKDEEFHKIAGLLSTASRKHNEKLTILYYSKLLMACSQCHSQHAIKQFPLFVPKPVTKSVKKK